MTYRNKFCASSPEIVEPDIFLKSVRNKAANEYCYNNLDSCRKHNLKCKSNGQPCEQRADPSKTPEPKHIEQPKANFAAALFCYEETYSLERGSRADVKNKPGRYVPVHCNEL